MDNSHDPDMEQLLRTALETEEARELDSGPCGSYASLTLLMDGADSRYISADHVASCSTCGPMLARLLARRCPAVPVLKQYRQQASGLGSVAALGWHIVGCKWCRLRLALAPLTPASLKTAPQVSVAGLAASCAAVLFFAGLSGWFGWQLHREKSAMAARESRRGVEKAAAENRIQQLGRELHESQQAQSGQTRPDSPGNLQARLTLPPSLDLFPDISRDGNAAGGQASVQIVRISPRTAATVHLKLETDIALRAGLYGIAVRAESGNIVWKADVPAAAPPGSGVTADIPSTVLQPGLYSVTLSGHESGGRTAVIHDYSFRVAPL